MFRFHCSVLNSLHPLCKDGEQWAFKDCMGSQAVGGEDAAEEGSILEKNAAELLEKVQKVFNRLYTHQSASSHTEKKTEAEVTYQSLFHSAHLVLQAGLSLVDIQPDQGLQLCW